MQPAPAWELGPFERRPGTILGPRSDVTFSCPVTRETVAWAAKDVFNPGAIVHNGRVALLVRAEDPVGRYLGTSRLGLAWSDDGFDFALEPDPVLFPDDDAWQPWEWPGGCEDPRLVASPDGGYVCLYTAFDGKSAALCAATSDDLRRWEKQGPVFAGGAHARRLSKSGAIVTEVANGRLVAARMGGQYWMYWGEGVCYAATSNDLLSWAPVEFDPGADRYLTLADDRRSWEVHRIAGPPVLQPMLHPRSGRFDSLLVEPGPPAVRTGHGIVLIYNGANHPRRGDPTSPPFAYQPGQALFDANDPANVVARGTAPFLTPDGEAATGQVDNVVFAQGLVLHRGQWILYFGMADSKIGCAVAPEPDAGSYPGAGGP